MYYHFAGSMANETFGKADLLQSYNSSVRLSGDFKWFPPYHVLAELESLRNPERMNVTIFGLHNRARLYDCHLVRPLKLADDLPRNIPAAINPATYPTVR